MASNGKRFNTKVVRLVETVDSDINLLNARSYAICGGKTRSETETAESFWTDRVDLIGETELVRKFTRELAMLTQ